MENLFLIHINCVLNIKSRKKKINKSNILCIGDSLETDILGANQFGLNSLLITNGIHKNELHTLIILDIRN